MPQYVVQQGDCISSIAYEHGIAPDTIWNHPDNSELKNKRKNRDTLYPGDVVFIPETTLGTEDCATDQRHHFVVKNTPAKLRLRLLINDQPRANEEFTLIVDGQQRTGKTDGDGWLEQYIAPNAREGKLILTSTGEEYELLLGNMDPIDEIAGIQGRLRNLGFYGGELDGEMSPELEDAIRAFQTAKQLPVTGQATAPTKDALRAAYGH